MRKLGFALFLAVAVTLGGTSVAAQDYPPNGPIVTVTPSTVGPDGTITIGIQGGAPGESLTIIISIHITIIVVVPQFGTVVPGAPPSEPGDETLLVSDVPVPEAPGSYIGTVSGPALGERAFRVEVAEDAPTTAGGPPVAAAQLPATGSSNLGSTLRVAIVLVIAGATLAAVGRLRRRDEHPSRAPRSAAASDVLPLAASTTPAAGAPPGALPPPSALPPPLRRDTTHRE